MAAQPLPGCVERLLILPVPDLAQQALLAALVAQVLLEHTPGLHQQFLHLDGQGLERGRGGIPGQRLPLLLQHRGRVDQTDLLSHGLRLVIRDRHVVRGDVREVLGVGLHPVQSVRRLLGSDQIHLLSKHRRACRGARLRLVHLLDRAEHDLHLVAGDGHLLVRIVSVESGQQFLGGQGFRARRALGQPTVRAGQSPGVHPELLGLLGAVGQVRLTIRQQQTHHPVVHGDLQQTRLGGGRRDVGPVLVQPPATAAVVEGHLHDQPDALLVQIQPVDRTRGLLALLREVLLHRLESGALHLLPACARLGLDLRGRARCLVALGLRDGGVVHHLLGGLRHRLGHIGHLRGVQPRMNLHLRARVDLRVGLHQRLRELRLLLGLQAAQRHPAQHDGRIRHPIPAVHLPVWALREPPQPCQPRLLGDRRGHQREVGGDRYRRVLLGAHRLPRQRRAVLLALLDQLVVGQHPEVILHRERGVHEPEGSSRLHVLGDDRPDGLPVPKRTFRRSYFADHFRGHQTPASKCAQVRRVLISLTAGWEMP